MYTRTTILCFAVAFGLIGVPHEAHAQSPLVDGPAFLVTPMLALVLDEDADPSLGIAGALAYPLTRNVAVEGELGHVIDMTPGDPDVDSSLTSVHGSLLYFFDSEYRLVPYVAGGIGFAKFSHQVTRPPAAVERTEAGFNLGGGVTIPLADGIWGRGDLRFFNHIDDVPSVWRLSASVTLRIGQ